MDTIDINKVRGKILFNKIIDESSLDQKRLNRAKDLAKGFEDIVGVAGVDGVYPAKRLALAVLEVATYDYDGLGFDLGPDLVIKYFNENLSDSHPAIIEKSNFIPSGSEISGKWGKSFEAETDIFEKELRSNSEDAINLIEDANISDLSVEGLRNIGLIDPRFNSNTDILPKFESEELIGKIYFDENGSIMSVECPNCMQKDCYFISLDKYGCFGCDKEFKVPMEMGDNL